MLSRNISRAVRSFSTSAARSHGGGKAFEPGDNLPFDIHNRYKVLLVFSVYFGTAAAFPFWVVKRAIDKEA